MNKRKKKRLKADLGEKYTDWELIELEKEIHKLYSDCQKEIQAEMDDFFAKFEPKNKKWLKKLKNGEITEAEYKRWLEGQIYQGKMWGERRENLANALYNYNKIAYNMVNEVSPDVFLHNFNYMGYLLERDVNIDFSFQIYDSTSIKKLIFDDIEVIPYKKLDKAKDIYWNFQNIKREVAKAIIKGDSVNQLAKILAKEVTNRNEKQMKKHARTALISARNQGRLARMQEAEKMGIHVKKKWNAVLDERTRLAHAQLDGQIVDMDKPFRIGGQEIRFPGDPHAHPSLVYNCRCRLDARVTDYPSEFNLRRDNQTGELIGNMTYSEWYYRKTGTPLPPFTGVRKKRRK